MPSLQRVIGQEDFSSGMVRDVAPHLIPADGALDILNGLLNEDGSIYRRGGSEYKSNAAFGSGLRFIWDGFLGPGQRTLIANADDFGVLAADDTTVTNLTGSIASLSITKPLTASEIEGLLFISGGYIYGGSRKTANFTAIGAQVTNSSKTVNYAPGGFTANVDPGMLMQVGDERVYVVETVNSDTQITLRDEYEGATSGVATAVFHNLYVIDAADPYEVSEHYAVCANRLICFRDNVVLFSEIQAPDDYTNQFGTENTHEVPDGVEIVGLGEAGKNLLIFTTAGVWTLQGLVFDIVDAEGTPNHRLQVLSHDVILWGQAGIAAWEQAVVVPAANGVYLMDGVSRPVLLSQNVQPILDFYVDGPYKPGGAVVFRNHYLLPILDASMAVKEFLVCRLRRAKEGRSGFAWTRFNGAGAGMAGMAIRVGGATSAREPKLFGAVAGSVSRIADLSHFWEPDADHKTDADGSIHVCDIISRDYETGNLTLNVVRRLRSRYELVDAGTDDPTIKFSWGDGSTSGLATWGEVEWNEFTWSASGASFFGLTPDGGESNGNDPHSCRVNKRRRFVRVRARNHGPCASYVHRSFELYVRPSQAVRR
jgi:hypothetical protein